MSGDSEERWSLPNDSPWAHLIKHSSDVITLLDEDGTILFESPATERILGYEPGELIGTNAFAHIHPHDSAEIIDAFSSLVGNAGETTQRVEYRFRHADDHWVWLETIGSNRQDSTLGGYVLNSRDITEKKQRERKLSETTRQLESVLNNIESVVWMRDEESRFTLVNDKYRELFDISKEVRIEGKRPEELVGQNTGAQFRLNDQRAIRAKEAVAFEEVVELENESRYFLTVITPVYYDSGDLFATCGVATDITDQKRRERELRERTKELHALHETAQLFATSSDPLETLLKELVDRASDWFQFPEKTEVRVTYGDIQVQTPYFRSSHIKFRTHGTDEEGGHIQFEVAQTLNTPDGTPSQFLQEEGDLVETVTQLLTETVTRRSQEQTLELFRHAIDEVGHSVIITDRDGIIEYVNPAFEDQTGYESEFAVGKNPRILKSGQQDQAIYERLWDTILAGETWESEIINRRRDGSLYHVDQIISPIIRDGEITNFVSIEADTTQRRIREQQLEVLNRLLRHNLRNSLTVIGGHASLICERATEEQILNSAQAITHQSDRLVGISKKNTHVGRMFESPVAKDATIDLTPVLQSLEKPLLKQYPSAEISFEHPESVSILADGSVAIALRELLENALIHARHDSPSVWVEVEETNQQPFIEIRIIDDGPGMPPDQIKMLTEGTESPLVHGSGLGLWIVYWVISRLGGEVKIESSDQEGTEVILRLPQA